MIKISRRNYFIIVGIILIAGFTWYFYKEVNDYTTAIVGVGEFIQTDREYYLLTSLSQIKWAYDSAFRKIIIADGLIIVILTIVWNLPFKLLCTRKISDTVIKDKR